LVGHVDLARKKFVMAQQTSIVLSRVGWLVAVWFGACAMSPVLPDAKTLTGEWFVAEEGSTQSCAVKFTLRPLGNGHAVETDAQCLGALRLNSVVLWRAAPDGIALASESGRTIAFFSREGAGYVLRRASCPSLLLARAATTR
jgi:hypothetical protein